MGSGWESNPRPPGFRSSPLLLYKRNSFFQFSWQDKNVNAPINNFFHMHSLKCDKTIIPLRGIVISFTTYISTKHYPIIEKFSLQFYFHHQCFSAKLLFTLKEIVRKLLKEKKKHIRKKLTVRHHFLLHCSSICQTFYL